VVVQRIACIIAIAAALSAGACASECLGPSHNRSVPDPGPGEFQLIMNNDLSRDMPILVDGTEVGAICGESDYVVVGNFPVRECTSLSVEEVINQRGICPLTPCGGIICEQECDTNCHDTRPYAGRIFDGRMCWVGDEGCDGP
jgi:hypothetical protein